ALSETHAVIVPVRKGRTLSGLCAKGAAPAKTHAFGSAPGRQIRTRDQPPDEQGDDEGGERRLGDEARDGSRPRAQARRARPPRLGADRSVQSVPQHGTHFFAGLIAFWSAKAPYRSAPPGISELQRRTAFKSSRRP